MTIYLKQSTASQEVPLGPFLDSTDGNTQETGLTIANTDIKVWKTGATTLANKNSGGATHIANGRYYCVLDATDTDTLGPLVLMVHVSGALAVKQECVVLAANIYDSLIGGGDILDVSVTQWTGTTVASPNTAGYPVVTIKDGTGTGEIDTTSGGVLVAAFANNALTAAAIDADAFTAAKFASDVTTELQSGLATASALSTVASYIDTEVAAIKDKTDLIPATVDGKTLTEALVIILAALAGKASGLGTTTATFRSIDDTVDRIVATVDADGNRSAVTLDVTSP